MSEHHERHEEWREQLISIKILEKLDCIERKVDQLMSQVTDFAAKVQAHFDSITAKIKSLDDKIQAFQNSPGTLSAADQAALDVIANESAALDTAADAPLPPAPSA